tara:strand:- start:1563 stop:2246 length:684 start_codon:yes stop_codon:yes gene_type:complete
MRKEDLAGKVRTAAVRAGADQPERVISDLCSYLLLLWKWNKKINLTKLDDSISGLDRLVVEPLTVAKEEMRRKPSYKVIDIGSGGGSPAIPMNLANRESSLVMVEKKEKKGIFLREVIRVLGLENVSVTTAHYQDLVVESGFQKQFDLLTVRGVRVDRKALLTLKLFLKDGGRLLVFGSMEKMGNEELRESGFSSVEIKNFVVGQVETTVFTCSEKKANLIFTKSVK